MPDEETVNRVLDELKPYVERAVENPDYVNSGDFALDAQHILESNVPS